MMIAPYSDQYYANNGGTNTCNSSCVGELDSISQISAMDSASQTGPVVHNDSNSSSSHFHKNFSSDSNIHRSSSVHESGHRRGQFPYAYIRSKLSVLPEEQAGQLSRRESMNQNDGEMNNVAYRVMVHHHRQQQQQLHDEEDEDDIDDEELLDDDGMSECLSVTTRSEIVGPVLNASKFR